MQGFGEHGSSGVVVGFKVVDVVRLVEDSLVEDVERETEEVESFSVVTVIDKLEASCETTPVDKGTDLSAVVSSSAVVRIVKPAASVVKDKSIVFVVGDITAEFVVTLVIEAALVESI